MENGGNREGVTWVEGATPKGTRVTQTGEGRTTTKCITGGTTCANGLNSARTGSVLIRIVVFRWIGWTIIGAGLHSGDWVSAWTDGYRHGVAGVRVGHRPHASPPRGRPTNFITSRRWESPKWLRRHLHPWRSAGRRDPQHLIWQVST